MARRDDREYREYLREEQRSQPGCPARELCREPRGRDTRMTPTARYWLRMAALNVAAALFVAVAFNGVTWRTPWRRTLEVFSVGFVFASTIGPMCAVVIPRLAHAVFCRLRFAFAWAALIVTMTVL